ncbi:MAG: hypothetical protein WA359_02295 [Acidimicrobiales bacterium]
MLTKPGGDAPGDATGTAKYDAPVGKGVSKAGITHPDLGQGPKVGFEDHVNLSTRVGETEVDVVRVDNKPKVTVFGRQSREDELNRDASAAKPAWLEITPNVPEQQARV